MRRCTAPSVRVGTEFTSRALAAVPKKGALFAGGCGCLLVGLVGMLLVAAWFGIEPIAQHLVEGWLVDRGVRCEPLRVTAEGFPPDVRVAPTLCVLDGDGVERIELVESARLILSGTSVSEVHLTNANLEFSETSQLDYPMAPIPRALAPLVPNLQAFMIRAASLATQDLPSFDIDRLQLGYLGSDVSRLEGVSVRGTSGAYRLDVERATVRSPPVTIESISSSIRPTTVETTAVVDASIRVLFVDIGSRVPVRMTGEDLDTDEPSFAVRLGGD